MGKGKNGIKKIIIYPYMWEVYINWHILSGHTCDLDLSTHALGFLIAFHHRSKSSLVVNPRDDRWPGAKEPPERRLYMPPVTLNEYIIIVNNDNGNRMRRNSVKVLSAKKYDISARIIAIER